MFPGVPAPVTGYSAQIVINLEVVSPLQPMAEVLSTLSHGVSWNYVGEEYKK